VFDGACTARGDAGDKTFVVGGQADARRNGKVAEGEEVEEEAGHGKKAVAFGTERCDEEAGGITSAGCETGATWEAEGPTKGAAEEGYRTITDSEKGFSRGLDKFQEAERGKEEGESWEEIGLPLGKRSEEARKSGRGANGKGWGESRGRENEPVGGCFLVEGDGKAVRRESAEGARWGGRVVAGALTGV